MTGAIWSVLMDWIGTLGSLASISEDSGGGMDPNGHH
jgi:hypothetical protein